MFIDKDSIIVNGTSLGPYILEAKFGFHKLWGKDSGRNLAGQMTGSLIGIFPKFTMQFRKLTKAELEILAPILDSAYQTTQYYDPYKQAMTTMETYSNDWEHTNKKVITNEDGGKNEGFSWAIISTSRRV